MDLDARRIKLYQASFLLALVLASATAGTAWGMAGWLFTAGTCGLIGLGLLPAMAWIIRPLLQPLVLLSSAAVVIVPIAQATQGFHQSLATALPTMTPGPMILACVLGSRLLAAQSDSDFRELWREATLSRGLVRRQSFAAALLLGIGLWLCSSWLISLVPVAGGEPALMIVHSALTGGTLIHYAILLLFFSILAWLVEALLTQRSDRRIAQDILAQVGTTAEAAALRHHADRAISHVIRETLQAKRHVESTESDQQHEAFHAFARASTGFVRGLLPVLPLLGFLGTVIGLARAMADLPAALGPSAGGVDLTGTLSGLAVKFETTLLGLLTSMIAAVLLNLLDKTEAELAGQVSLASLQRLQDGERDPA